jgi:hypothetical protein
METFVQMMADRGAKVLKIASRRCVGVLPLSVFAAERPVDVRQVSVLEECAESSQSRDRCRWAR